MMHTIRKTLPSLGLLIAVAPIYAGISIAEHLTFAASDPAHNTVGVLAGGTVRAVFLLLFCGFCGAYRVVAAHPKSRSDYLEWLKTTPWNYRKPLPLGPVHHTWPDLIMPTVIILLEWHSPAMALHWIPLTIALSYTALLMTTFDPEQTGHHTIALLLGFGLFLALSTSVAAMLAIAAALYLIALSGMRRSSSGFPWQEPEARFGPGQKGAGSPAITRKHREPEIPTAVGWPFTKTARFDIKPTARSAQSLGIAFFTAWWAFAITYRLYPLEALGVRLGTLIIFALLVWLLPAAVLISYTSYARAPINLWGRLRTGRLVIPAYDRIYIGPFISFIAGAISWLAIYELPYPPYITLPAAFFVFLFLVTRLHPTTEDWLLTGAYSMITTDHPPTRR